ncbi:DUF2125 domain-containing protein [Tropicibacter sp. Alg240-R139]|uniref:DUF2125 domain-containing protein n=1 Tax=Tropicibacter sp. Alg240-R139 TaxID=2305991 RepID=UPI0013DEEE97|nr:DUF2125 domain-containing protein [Tropicibacter sp. Alg240-R139]
MSVFFRRSCGAAIAYAVATQGAWADLTANDVWADWQAYMGGMGYSISGGENTSGNITTVSDLTMSMEIPDAEASFELIMPEVTFTENGDGTVAIGMPEQFPVTLNIAAEGEDPVKVVLDYTLTNMAMVVSGTPTDMTYTYSVDKNAVTLSSLEAEGEAMPEGALNVSFVLDALAGTSQMQIGETMRDIAQNLTAGNITYDIAFDDPESDDAGSFSGSIADVSYTGSGSIPNKINAADYGAFLNSGFKFDGGLSYKSGNGAMQGTGDGDAFAMSSKSTGGDFRFAMDSNHLLYDLGQSGSEISVTVQDLPFPIDLKMAKSGFKLDMPIQAGDAPQPFAFGMNLTDFTMSDMIWGMFDPAGALPHDPATVALDTTGTAKVLVDFLDPKVAETLESTGAAPGELNTLKINELLISMVGAKLGATGDFEFDNSNLEAFDGMPAPSGVANLELSGANALIDKLIAMGFVSDQDAMGARMMMGLLAVPGDGPDTLKSTIEINKQGHIVANGQRIK